MAKKRRPKSEYMTIDVGRSIAPAGLALFPKKMPKTISIAGKKRRIDKEGWLIVCDVESGEAEEKYGDEPSVCNILHSTDILRPKKKLKKVT